jgi:hypothetical protein
MNTRRTFLGLLIASPLAALVKPMLPKPFNLHAYLTLVFTEAKRRQANPDCGSILNCKANVLSPQEIENLFSSPTDRPPLLFNIRAL